MIILYFSIAHILYNPCKIVLIYKSLVLVSHISKHILTCHEFFNFFSCCKNCQSSV